MYNIKYIIPIKKYIFCVQQMLAWIHMYLTLTYIIYTSFKRHCNTRCFHALAQCLTNCKSNGCFFYNTILYNILTTNTQTHFGLIVIPFFLKINTYGNQRRCRKQWTPAVILLHHDSSPILYASTCFIFILLFCPIFLNPLIGVRIHH